MTEMFHVKHSFLSLSTTSDSRFAALGWSIIA
jgi:hypothetical protein